VSARTALNAGLAGQIEIGPFTVNRLGYGAMRITGQGIWGEPKDPAEARRVLRRAVELGVNFIDTAHSYGPEVSERLIAEALHPYPGNLVIATKSGLERGGPDTWWADGRPDVLRRDCERSLTLLRLERIDVFQLHAVDAKVPYAESLGTLVDLQREGKIRAIGVSNVTAAQLEQALAQTTVVSVQNRYSASDHSSDEVLEICEREGIAFIPWFPLGAGRLAQPGASGGAEGGTPAQLAIAWLLQRSPNILPIPGTSSVAHLEENLGAAAIAAGAPIGFAS